MVREPTTGHQNEGGETTSRWWEDFNRTSENVVDSHAPLHSFESEYAAIHFWKHRGGSLEAVKSLPRVICLNDESGSERAWRFKLVPSPDEAPHGFEEVEFDDTSWETIPVPYSWQLTDAGGHDVPIYTNQMYPFPLDPPRTRRVGKCTKGASDGDEVTGAGMGWKWVATNNTSEPEKEAKSRSEEGKENGMMPNPSGIYRRRFEVPKEWIEGGSSVRLVLESADSAAECYVNGTYIGMGKDSRLPMEFDITEAIHADAETENQLALRIPRFNDGSYMEDQDQWWLSGLQRDVYLTSKPKKHIGDMNVTTAIQHEAEPQEGKRQACKANASINVRVSLQHATRETNDAFDGMTVKLTARDLKQANTINNDEYRDDKGGSGDDDDEGPVACVMRKITEEKRGRCIARGVHDMEVRVGDAKLWSPEHPNLYLVVAELLDEDGTFLEAEACRVGVRETRIEKGRFQLNKAPTQIFGVNVHEHDHFRGKAMREAQMLKDLLQIKRNNFNAVRMSHYPHHPRYYDLCDEIGLLVVDEANVETHGFRIAGQPVGFLMRRQYGEMIRRFQRMRRRNYNHPSICFWSLGNEAGLSENFKAEVKNLRKLERRKGRNDGRIWQYESDGSSSEISDIVCPMYARVQTLQDLVKKKGRKDERPIIMCEYSHAMNNSNGNLKEYFDLFERERRVQGGFIWDFVDQGLVRNGRWVYGGGFHDFPHDGPFNVNGVTFPDRSPKPALWELKHFQKPVHVLFATLKPIKGGKGEQHDQFGLFVKTWNGHACTSLQDFMLKWRAHTDEGATIKHGEHTFGGGDANAAVECVIATVAQPLGDVGDSDAFFTAEIFNPKGSSIGASQVGLFVPQQLRGSNCAPAQPSREREWSDAVETEPTVEEGNEQIAVRCSTVNDETVITFEKKGELAGQMSSLRSVKHGSVMERGLRMCFYRARTDNDKGGGPFSFARRWKSAGLDELRPCASPSLKINAEEQTCGKRRASVSVLSKFELTKNGSQTVPGIGVQIHTRIDGNARMEMEYEVSIPKCYPKLARVGVRAELPPAFDTVCWLGRGPHENYPDRKSSAFFDLYSRSVQDMPTRYIVPSENGGRSDCKFVEFSGAETGESPTLRISSQKPSSFVQADGTSSTFQMSCNRYSLEQLDSASNRADLEEEEKVHLHIDARHHGLGGDDSWTPTTLPRYTVSSGKVYSMGLALELST